MYRQKTTNTVVPQNEVFDTIKHCHDRVGHTGQILVDSDGEFRWILHMRDHYSKFSWTHPLTSKRTSEVASKVRLSGAPKMLQSDNGWEFVAALIEELTKSWPGLTIIHRRP